MVKLADFNLFKTEDNKLVNRFLRYDRETEEYYNPSIDIKKLLRTTDKRARAKMLEKELGLRVINLDQYINYGGKYGTSYVYPVESFMEGVAKIFKKNIRRQHILGTETSVTIGGGYVLPAGNEKMIEKIKQIIAQMQPSAQDAIAIKIEYLVFYDNIPVTGIRAFNIERLKDINKIFKEIILWGNTFQDGDAYVPHIEKIYINVIPENGGGCSTTQYKKVNLDGMELKNPRSKDNNCFFACIKDFCKLEKLTKPYCNQLRALVGAEPNSLVTITQAMQIFEHIVQKQKKILKIINNEEGKTHISSNTKITDSSKKEMLTLFLRNNHYMILEGSSETKCAICHAIYKKKHTCPPKCESCSWFHYGKCSPQRLAFYQRKTGINSNFVKYQGRFENYRNDNIIHYDLETFVNDNNEHIPYIAGFVWENKFQYFAGDDCINKFVLFIIELAKNRYTRQLKTIPNKALKKEYQALHPGEKFDMQWWYNKISAEKPTNKYGWPKYDLDNGNIYKRQYDVLYLNAFYGSKFDHFKLYANFKKSGLGAAKDRLMSNNSILKANFANIVFFDLWKHTVGSLRSNLESFNCKIQKGEFDHKRSCRWEDMDCGTRQDCLKYLEGDVMGLKELYDKLSLANHKQFGTNLTGLISTSQNAYQQWTKTLKDIKIPLPTLEEYKDFRSSLYAGRCYKAKSNFTSTEYDRYMRGELKYNDIDDYIIDLDVNSLYPAAMKCLYPAGETFKMQAAHIAMENECLKLTKEFRYLSICRIKFKANRYLAHSILPRREDLALIWDLNDNEGWYNSIDIENAVRYGYEVEILEGYYWKESHKVFEHYIDDLYKIKKQAKIDSNPALYQLAKLLMNGLYGKMCQRPIFDETVDVKSNAEFWKFFGTHVIKEIIEIGEEFCLVGQKREDFALEACLTKPTQLGSFILGYSRRIMLEYMNKLNPYFNIAASNDIEQDSKLQRENDIYYTDTDSLQVHVKQLMHTDIKISDELGEMGFDIPGKIIKAFFIQPKLYCDVYAVNAGYPGKYCNSKECNAKKKADKCNGDIHLHLKGKGVQNSKLELQHFETLNSGKAVEITADMRIKRIGLKRNSKELAFDQFSLVNITGEALKKVIGKQPYLGRCFIDNVSVPNNHICAV
jgi:hypothetical protein